MDKTTRLKAAYAAPFTEIFECGHPWPLAASNTGFDGGHGDGLDNGDIGGGGGGGGAGEGGDDGEITGAKGFSLAGFAPWEGDDLWN